MKTNTGIMNEKINGFLDDLIIGVVGLGYVGLPVALGFSRKFKVIGYDVNKERIHSLQHHIDNTREVSSKLLKESSITFTLDEKQLNSCHVIIVTVPTPLNANKEPDLSYLIAASTTIGKNMKRGTIIVYESTVYPGATEETCIPTLEKSSRLTCGEDFFVGYSPERINPGDKTHTFFNTEKIVAAQNKETLDKIYHLYQKVIDAEVHKVNSIKVAEAAKLVENTQRDINIAFMNELSLIFKQMGISTYDVLDAAKTKWNFTPFYPGLVGGHCIGVDPYYFIYKSKIKGYHPEFLETARKVNEHIPTIIVDTVLSYIDEHLDGDNQINIGILGLTFKENIPDIRNSKSVEIALTLADYGLNVYVHDPYVMPTDFPHQLKVVEWEELKDLSIVILAVPHQEYRNRKEIDFQKLFIDKGLIIDIKGLFWQHHFPPFIKVISL
ncbi:nucleotide sugar dehydrogenase [Ornithinibacillus bavariensis]|uniref:UDP-N-acetyl-D-galactosamine dehydrogenase n=1 Tax=Ornithinibacillus bavariensis TaxID=545502 RepID=A0A919X9J3_9BACI|nr:nucleotide sugar dehydrogenase [Ornithinibacillus bavariensis]GIO28081.1 UDP-N-acetyl-D-galactosamine dehydrogenase [Ornithinibacillus bavariensis]